MSNIGYIRDESYKIIQKISNPNRDWVIEKLDSHVCLILFRKKLNGQFRALKCTRDVEKLPRQYKTLLSTQGIYNPNGYDDLIPVWEVDSREWKSFYLNSIFSITVLLGESKKGKQK